MHNQRSAIRTILEARRCGKTLRQAAAAAGVPLATVCRWGAKDAKFLKKLRDAEAAEQRLLMESRGPKPSIPWHSDCPVCAATVVKSTYWGSRFCSCSRWPRSRWASWRRRLPIDFPDCGGVRYWSDCRKSISCSKCRKRLDLEKMQPELTERLKKLDPWAWE